MVETVQLVLVWAMVAKAADEKQTPVLGSMLRFNWSWQAVWLGGAGAAATFALNATLTIAAALSLALLAAVVGSPGEATVAVHSATNAHDAGATRCVCGSCSRLIPGSRGGLAAYQIQPDRLWQHSQVSHTDPFQRLQQYFDRETAPLQWQCSLPVEC